MYVNLFIESSSTSGDDSSDSACSDEVSEGVKKHLLFRGHVPYQRGRVDPPPTKKIYSASPELIFFVNHFSLINFLVAL